MTPENLLREETVLWIKHAQADLRAAAVVLNAGLIEQSLFHSQQAAEKSLKAFLTWHRSPFPKTHDLSELQPMCCQIDGSLMEVATQAETLPKYAVRFRYPGAPYEPDQAEGEDALRLATRLYEEIRRRVPPPLDESPEVRQS